MKSPDKTLFFFFRSVPMARNADMWIVRATLPPNASPETLMPIYATDGDEKPLDSAIFGFSGCRVEISDGKGAVSYGDFVNGMCEKGVWMFRQGLKPVPGYLAFG